MSHLRFRVAALVALLILALPAATLAATVTETLTILSSTTLSGVPTSIAWGTAMGGTNLVAPDMALTVVSDAPAGYDLTGVITDMTRSAGGVVAKEQHLLTTNSASPGITLNPYYAVSGQRYSAAQTGLAFRTSATAGDNITLSMRLIIPLGTTPGNYTGSFTISVAGR